MKVSIHISFLLMLAIGIFCSEKSFGQCGNNNTFLSALDPTGAGSSLSTAIQGGQYVTVNVCAGATYTFSTCGDFDFDTQITLYNNADGSYLGYNDDGCGLQSTITWLASFTGTVRVLVDRYFCSNSGASSTLNVTQTNACGTSMPPTNDPCSGAEPISCGTIVIGSTIGAAPDAIPAGCGSAASPGLWYTLLGDGATYILDLCASGYDTQISVYTGDCNGLICYAYNDDDFLCGLASYVSFPTVNGVLYYVQVHGWANYSGPFEMIVDCYTETANDPCSGAVPVSCGETDTGSTVGYNTDLIPAGCGFSVSGGLWYSIVGNGEAITASLCSAAYDTQISVFSGDCTVLNCVETNDDLCGAQSEVSFLSLTGITYYILVHGYFDEGGFELSIACNPYVPGPQDCSGSITICTDTQFGGNSSGTGLLEDLDPANQGCLAGAENQSSWYVFQPTTTGTISFTINPTPIVDYDFAIWGPMTSPTCPPPGPPLRCSFSGLYAPTGLGNGAVDTSEGAGGDAWVAPITVAAGDVNGYYFMCLDNFSVSTTPFVFDWSLSGVILNCSIMLPVEFNQFTGEAQGLQNVLHWDTKSELNNSHFEVLRSTDAIHFEKIGEVQGNGTSFTTNEYAFIDRSPHALTCYYQLSQVDYNGASERSEIIGITREAIVSISPNPVEDLLNLGIMSSSQQLIDVKLMDITGRMVMQQRFAASASNGMVQWNTSSLPSGLYALTAFTAAGELVLSEKLVKR